PLVLTCLERSVALRSARWSILGALALSAQLLAGHTQEVYYTSWALGLFALYLVLRGGESFRGRLLGPVSLGFMGALAAGLSAVQLLPTLELATLSYRSGGVSLPEAASYSVPLQDVLDSILPLYWWAPYVDVVGFSGAVALVLAPAALALRGRGGMAWLFVLLAGLALVLSLGDQTPLFGILHGYVPGFDLFRAAGRWLFLYGFSLAVLAGMGAEALWSEERSPSASRLVGAYGAGLLLLVAGFLALGLWAAVRGVEIGLPHPRVLAAVGLFMLAGVGCSLLLASRSGRPLAVVLLGALICGELYMAKEPLEYNRPAPAVLYSAQDALLPFLSGESSHRTLLVIGDRPGLVGATELAPYLAGTTDKGRGDELHRYASLKAAGAGDTTMMWGINSPDGYDGGLLPLDSYARLVDGLLGEGQVRADMPIRELLQPSGRTVVPDSRRMAVLGVSSLVVGEEVEVRDPGWQLLGTGYPGQTKLLRNAWSSGRAKIVYSSVVEPDSDRAIEAILEADPPGSRVVLAEGVASAGAGPAQDRVETRLDSPTEIVVATHSDAPGFLVLRDSYYPGWRAQVDGVETQVHRADLAFRAVALPQGTHSVRFFYDPASLKVGLIVSVLSWALACALFAWWHRLASRLRIT
ncbi:MAG TPA: YfhO family protein, partial [Chloroflexota bacterium]|nr:YfhO family protein [Chloroflexota bacterium]